MDLRKQLLGHSNNFWASLSLVPVHKHVLIRFVEWPESVTMFRRDLYRSMLLGTFGKFSWGRQAPSLAWSAGDTLVGVN